MLPDEFTYLLPGDKCILLINFFIIPCKHCKRMLEYIEENYNLTFAADTDRSVYVRFAEKKVPRNYLFDAEGKLIYQTRGFSPDQMNTLRSILEELIL